MAVLFAACLCDCGYFPEDASDLDGCMMHHKKDMISADCKVCIFSIGTMVGTKAKQVQTSTLTRGYLIGLVRRQKLYTPSDSRFFPYSYSQYLALLRKLCTRIWGFEIRLTSFRCSRVPRFSSAPVTDPCKMPAKGIFLNEEDQKYWPRWGEGEGHAGPRPDRYPTPTKNRSRTPPPPPSTAKLAVGGRFASPTKASLSGRPAIESNAIQKQTAEIILEPDAAKTAAPRAASGRQAARTRSATWKRCRSQAR